MRRTRLADSPAKRSPARLAHLVGDLLVRYPRATGRGAKGERIPFNIDNGRHAGGLTHFHVLNDPDIYRQIHAWLERDRSPSLHTRP